MKDQYIFHLNTKFSETINNYLFAYGGNIGCWFKNNSLLIVLIINSARKFKFTLLKAPFCQLFCKHCSHVCIQTFGGLINTQLFRCVIYILKQPFPKYFLIYCIIVLQFSQIIFSIKYILMKYLLNVNFPAKFVTFNVFINK